MVYQVGSEIRGEKISRSLHQTKLKRQSSHAFRSQDGEKINAVTTLSLTQKMTHPPRNYSTSFEATEK